MKTKGPGNGSLASYVVMYRILVMWSIGVPTMKSGGLYNLDAIHLSKRGTNPVVDRLAKVVRRVLNQEKKGRVERGNK